MHVHILGIGGTFMGGVAQLAVSLGHHVTGADLKIYPPMSTQLDQLGITLFEGYDTAQLAEKPDCVIIGNALSRGNPCVEYCMSHAIPFYSGAGWIAQYVLPSRWVLAVAGTHGKTTTASMLAWILEYAGLNPGYLIGGVPSNFESSARLGTTPFFVIEADEYDTAFFDKRSKFVHYHPKTLIMNNLEFDHSDIFPNLASIQTQFHHLVRTVPGIGLIVHPAIDKALDAVLSQGCWTPTQTFGTTEADWQATLDQPAGHTFTLSKQGGAPVAVQWDLIGEHNINNATAAVAAAHHVGVPIEVAAEALQHFKNVKRRLEVYACVNQVTIYDDFAHHPTAVAATLAGLRAKVGTARIIAILDLRSNTFKKGDLKEALLPAVRQADNCWIYQSANVQWDVAALGSQMPVPTTVFYDTDALVAQAADLAQPGDHLLIMSNGDFEQLHTRIKQALTLSAQTASVG